MTYKVIMLRHGESQWTAENRFCGWYNSVLSEKGIAEGREAGKILKEAGFKFDVAFTSILSRACDTLNLIVNEIGSSNLEVIKTWRLNERHYGGLTGMRKDNAVEKYGREQVQIWRRSFDILPPVMDTSHPYYNKILEDIAILAEQDDEPIIIPKAETLKDTMERVIPYWIEVIVPEIRKARSVLIVTHGTSLRSLIKHLDDVSDSDILSVNLPTGIPFVYELDDKMKPVKAMKYLSDEETVRKGIKKAASTTLDRN